MTKGTRTNWEAHWIAAASLAMLCLALAAACEAETSTGPLEAQPNKSLKNWLLGFCCMGNILNAFVVL
jgi:hypothetical protein